MNAALVLMAVFAAQAALVLIGRRLFRSDLDRAGEAARLEARLAPYKLPPQTAGWQMAFRDAPLTEADAERAVAAVQAMLGREGR